MDRNIWEIGRERDWGRLDRWWAIINAASDSAPVMARTIILKTVKILIFSVAALFLTSDLDMRAKLIHPQPPPASALSEEIS